MEFFLMFFGSLVVILDILWMSKDAAKTVAIGISIGGTIYLLAGVYAGLLFFTIILLSILREKNLLGLKRKS